MKGFKTVLLVFTIAVASLVAHADDDNRKYNKYEKDKINNSAEHGSTDANEMSLLGVAAASLLGAGSFLLLRRRRGRADSSLTN